MYTSYYGQTVELKRQGCILVGISRTLPRWTPRPDYWETDLAPSLDLFQEKELPWELYKKRYLKELASKRTLVENILRKYEKMENDSETANIVFLCYESSLYESWTCHRILLSEFAKKEFGINIEEVVNG